MRPARCTLILAGTLCLACPTEAATFNYLSEPVDVSPGGTNAWVDVDVSAQVPAGATGVIIQAYNESSSDLEYGVRMNGSGDTWMEAGLTLQEDTAPYLMVGLDAGRIFEVWQDDNGIETHLVGYTMDGVTFFQDAKDKSLTATDSWEEVDISTDTGGDTAIGVILMMRSSTSSSDSYAVRKKGSGDDRYEDLRANMSTAVMIGVDASEIFELKIQNTAIDTYLMGYVTSGAVFFDNAVQKTIGTNSYIDIDITADLVGSDDANGAIVEWTTGDDRDLVATRMNGQGHDVYEYSSHLFSCVGIDAGDVFEGKVQNTSCIFYLVGYTLSFTPPTLSSASNQTFLTGDPLIAAGTITITDPSGVITAADDIRIRVPAGFNMLWNNTDLAATIGGTAAGKVSSTVSYEDAGATLVLDVTGDLAAGETVTVSDVSFMDFLAASAPDNLELEIYNDDAVTATDDKTIEIGAPTWRSIGTDSSVLYAAGDASITSGTSVVTFEGGAMLPIDVGLGDKLTIGSGAGFSDDFNDGVITGWTDIGEDNLSESSGYIRQSSATSDSHYSVNGGSGWTDYTVTCDIMAKDNDENGISFRVQDANNYYVLYQRFGQGGPNAWGLFLRKYVAGTPTDLATPVDQTGLSEDVWYELRVELSGNNIKCYFDGALEFDLNDSTFSDGTAGIWGLSQECRWDNMVVSTGAGSGGEFHILSRDSDTQATVQETASSTLAGQSYTIERAYNTMQAWEDDRDGDLVAEGRREIGVCYNDGVFTDRLVISGSTTDATYYMGLTVPAGERHGAAPDTGARIDAGGGWSSQDAIEVEDEYTRIEWLEITDVFDAGDAISFAESPAADNSTVTGVFVHGFWQNNNAAFRVAADNVTIRNCFTTGGTTYGVRIESTGSTMIENCTLWGGGYGVHGAASSAVSMRNTISVDHGSLDVYIETGGGATIPYFGYNMFGSYGGGFDPVSYAGNNQAPPNNLEHLFVDLTAMNLHLEVLGNRAGNTGLDLSSDFNDDIDGQTRVAAWDMGADEARPGTARATPKVLLWTEVER